MTAVSCAPQCVDGRVKPGHDGKEVDGRVDPRVEEPGGGHDGRAVDGRVSPRVDEPGGGHDENSTACRCNESGAAVFCAPQCVDGRVDARP